MSTSLAARRPVPDTAAFDGPVLDGRGVARSDVAGRRVAVLAATPQVADVVPLVAAHAAVTKVFLLARVRVLPPIPLVGATTVVPGLADRVARAHLRCAVRDPELRRKLSASRGGDAVVVSGAYLPALQSAGCQALGWPVTAVTERGVRTADGLEHLVDVIVRA